MNNKKIYKDKILTCLYKISKNNYIEEQYKEFTELSNEIPFFEEILEELRKDNLILYKHLSSGREQSLGKPLTKKGIEYCESINK